MKRTLRAHDRTTGTAASLTWGFSSIWGFRPDGAPASQWDVSVAAARARGLPERLRHPLAGLFGCDHLVDHIDGHGPADPAGNPDMLLGQLRLELFPFLVRRGGQLLPVQDAHRGLGPHHGDLRAGPGEDPRGSEGAGVHRDV